MKDILLNEILLPDDYPVYADYLYVCDGKVVRCDLIHGTIADLKVDLRSYYKLSANEITTCDIVGRQKVIAEQNKRIS
jgi:hypothetical protein